MNIRDFQANLFIVSAPSGAGKTSLLKALLQKMDNIIMATSHTTRAKRPGEQEGQDYYFIDNPTFEGMIQQNAFLEYARVFDHYYGTSIQAVEKHLAAGTDVILEIDWQGAEKVKQQCETVSVFILPPSLPALRQRLTGRGTDAPEVIEKRLAASVADIQHYRQADYVVINDRFEQAVEDLEAIIHAARLRTSKQQHRHAKLFNELAE